jgi:hypothetical protein
LSRPGAGAFDRLNKGVARPHAQADEVPTHTKQQRGETQRQQQLERPGKWDLASELRAGWQYQQQQRTQRQQRHGAHQVGSRFGQAGLGLLGHAAGALGGLGETTPEFGDGWEPVAGILGQPAQQDVLDG